VIGIRCPRCCCESTAGSTPFFSPFIVTTYGSYDVDLSFMCTGCGYKEELVFVFRSMPIEAKIGRIRCDPDQ
jgi:hypothetical protein